MTNQQAEALAARLSSIEHDVELSEHQIGYTGWAGAVPVAWHIARASGALSSLRLGYGIEGPLLYRWVLSRPWVFQMSTTHSELMARGLFRLGFDDPAILSQLPPLSAHEKLELRLSLPREFWPQTWLDEVKTCTPLT